MAERHRAIGYRKRQAGTEFEQRIESALETAAQAGFIAWWSHQQPAFTRFGVPLKATGADFAGVLRGGGSLAVECKSISSRRLMRSSIAAEQVRHLDAVAGHGGLALLAVEFRDDEAGLRSQHLAPWRAVTWTIARSAKSLDADALTQWPLLPTAAIAHLVRSCPTCRAVCSKWGHSPGCCFGSPPF